MIQQLKSTNKKHALARYGQEGEVLLNIMFCRGSRSLQSHGQINIDCHAGGCKSNLTNIELFMVINILQFIQLPSGFHKSFTISVNLMPSLSSQEYIHDNYMSDKIEFHSNVRESLK